MQWFRRFMYGRYGTDSLNKVLSVVSLALLLLSIITGWPAFYWPALLLMLCTLYRSFSRNTWKRGRENQVFLQAKGRVASGYARITTRYRQRKTHCFFKCQSCHTTLRVPKGRGRVKITCPKCHMTFEGRT